MLKISDSALKIFRLRIGIEMLKLLNRNDTSLQDVMLVAYRIQVSMLLVCVKYCRNICVTITISHLPRFIIISLTTVIIILSLYFRICSHN